MLGRGQKIIKDNARLILLFAVALMVGYIAGTRSGDISRFLRGDKGGIQTSEIRELYNALSSNYDGKIDSQTINDGIKRGMVAELDDPYTEYLTKDEAEKFQKELSGDIGGGIGAEIGTRNNVATIIRVLPGNPAYEAGLMAGDAVFSVNGEEMNGKSVDYVVSKVRGDVGTSVKIVVVRNGESKTFDVVRRSIIASSVEANLEGDIAILRLSRFDEASGDTLREEAQKLLNQGAKKVILDLRGNGGGLVTSAQKVAGLWLEKDQTVLVEKKGDKEIGREKATGRGAILANTPTVILTNEGSASASEIIAGALSEYKKATLVGAKTYGKGSVQQIINFSDGSALKVTIARWYTPGGGNISQKGIEPEYKVDLTADDVNNGRDPQKDKAIEILNSL